jgi:hypothetical protein
MMNGPEKSDPAIVAGKPTNKAEQSAAELVEPKAGTKGNAGQQSTCRTQSRVSVSQALERIRRLTAVTTRGAVCGKAARTDLCGGREVTRVPTAKDGFCSVHESGGGTQPTCPRGLPHVCCWVNSGTLCSH